MSPFSRRAIAVFTLLTCALVLPGAYGAADENDSSEGSAVAAEASPSPEPSPAPSVSATPEPPEPEPSATPEPEPSVTPTTPPPSPTPSAPSPSPTVDPPRRTLGEEESPLHLSLGAAPASIDIGEETTVGVTVTNPNDQPAQNVEVVVSLPRELEFVSSVPTPDSVSAGAQGTVVFFNDVDVPAQGWTTLALTARGVEETKGPATIDARARWQQYEPFETATVTVVAPPSSLRLETSGPGLLSTVGQMVEYEITLRNTGDAPLRDVAILNLVPDEVHVTSAGLAPGIDAVQVGNSGDAEDIVWTIDEMDAGEVVRVSYGGVVEEPGDLEALNRTRALTGSRIHAEQSERSYLAIASGADSDNPSFDPIVDRRVVTERVVERPLIRRRVPTEPDGVGTSDGAATTGALPFTGFDPWGTAASGIILIGFGFMFLRFGRGDFDRRRVVAVAFLVLLVGGACISSESDGPDDTRVKGTQIERGDAPDEGDTDAPDDDSPAGGDPERGEGGSQPARDDDPLGNDDDTGTDNTGTDDTGTDDTNEDVDDGTVADDGTAPEPEEPETEEVLVPGPPVTSFERRVVTTTLTQDDLAIASVSSITGAAPASFTWNDATSSGSGTASSRHQDVVEMRTSIVPSGSGMRATVTITNVAERTRTDVSGRLD
ncbi:MAG: hypothetical protein M3174_00050, partial [Actinomycetota bacterium]|nr:hypothetical protein [Actinomycetota bacterium]